MCLNSIYAQDYPESNFEVIVVDGGSTDGTKELCKEFPNIRFVTEKRFGLAHARNKGAELAHGSIVAYTDDDCIVDKYWLNNLVLGFRHFPSIAGVGGPVCPAHPDAIPQKILVKPALGLFDEGENIKLLQGIITSNSAFKREIFSAIQFDETLGTTRRGKLILCGEDVDFCQTLTKSGYKLLYTPSAKVYHQISKDRIRVWYIVKHAVHGGISMTKFLEKEKNSRVWMIRFAVGGLAQRLLAIIADRSFTSCYKIINSTSTLFICLTGMDKILLQKTPIDTKS
jgi:GT2 family glycosyltransferase